MRVPTREAKYPMVDVTGNCYSKDFFTVYFSTITMLVEKLTPERVFPKRR